MKHRPILSRRRWLCVATAAAVVCVAVAPQLFAADSAPAQPARKPAPPETLFWIGRADASAMEFGAARSGWQAFTKTFPKPIVFRVGTDKPAAWPFMHPSTTDTWAGGGAHTFTVEFNVAQMPKRPELFLIVGLVNAHPDPSLKFHPADFPPPPTRPSQVGKDWGRARLAVFAFDRPAERQLASAL